jgi:hypothetical protein
VDEVPVCRACPTNTFKEAVANLSVTSGSCTLAHGCCACPANEATLSAAAVHSDACVCQPGYGGASCARCAVGSYKAGTSDAACELCPTGSTTVADKSVSLADCVAARGFSGDSSTTFQQCAAGSYKPTTGSGSCTPCPAGSTSPAGATNIFQCVCSLTGWRSDPEHPMGCTCQPGFARDAGALCQPCAANFYCVGGDAAPAACQQLGLLATLGLLGPGLLCLLCLLRLLAKQHQSAGGTRNVGLHGPGHHGSQLAPLLHAAARGRAAGGERHRRHLGLHGEALLPSLLLPSLLHFPMMRKVAQLIGLITALEHRTCARSLEHRVCVAPRE